MTDTIRPFHVNVPESELIELRRRINATQWPEKETVADQSQGVPLATMQALARYWATDYDWRKREGRLKALPHFITNIEQLKIIDPLVNPTAHGGNASDAFDVVIPSMPGYGFSGKPTSTGWGPERMGRAWDALMSRLGYSSYLAQGGDWGAFIVDLMGVQEVPGLLAIHTNYPGTVPDEIDAAAAAGAPTPDGLSAAETRAYEHLVFSYKQVAYAKIMGTRPQTLYGIADSPVG